MIEIVLLKMLILIFLIIHPYTFYPMSLLLIRRRYSLTYDKSLQRNPKISILISAYNEEKHIKSKLTNLLEQDYPNENIEILIGNDGSTDKTLEIINNLSIPNLKIFSYERSGKSHVLNKLINESTGSIIVLTDAAIFLKKNALKYLIQPFVDSSQIGCVSGNIVYINQEGGKEQSYIEKFEKKLKILESKIGYLIGASGGLYAVKRDAVNEIKSNIVNDDFYISIKVYEKGYRAVLEPKAIAYKSKLSNFRQEIVRYRRDSAGHYQLITEILFNTNFKEWYVYYGFFSHRILRWLTPFIFILCVIGTLLISHTYSFVYTMLFFELVLILMLYLKMKGIVKFSIRNNIANSVLNYLLINMVMFFGFIDWLTGKQRGTWETMR